MDSFSYSKKTDLVWFTGMAFGFGLTLLSVIFTPWPAYKTGQFWVYATIFARLLLYWSAGEHADTKIFKSLLSMGLVVGVVELLADYWLVNGITAGRLNYFSTMHNDVVLLASPIWMPFAWAAVTVEFGYLILRLADIFKNPWLASIVGAVNAGIGVGIYEYLALYCGWWYYEPAKVMIGKACAVYIPAGEALLFLLFYLIFSKTRAIKTPRTQAAVSGIIFGLWIFASYAIAHFVLEGWK